MIPPARAYVKAEPERFSRIHYIGYGEKFDETKLHAHPAGTFFTEPANIPHFGRTKDEGAVLYFYGVGPSGSTLVEGADTKNK
jgi:hypothetical protein